MLDESKKLRPFTSVYVLESRILFDLVASDHERVKLVLTGEVLRYLLDELSQTPIKHALSAHRMLDITERDPEIALPAGGGVKR